jgi:hypothetical protein
MYFVQILSETSAILTEIFMVILNPFRSWGRSVRVATGHNLDNLGIQIELLGGAADFFFSTDLGPTQTSD